MIPTSTQCDLWLYNSSKTREALLAILKELHEEDYFALIKFDDSIDSWKESLTKATKENVAEAMLYVKAIQDKGGEKKKQVTFLFM